MSSIYDTMFIFCCVPSKRKDASFLYALRYGGREGNRAGKASFCAVNLRFSVTSLHSSIPTSSFIYLFIYSFVLFILFLHLCSLFYFFICALYFIYSFVFTLFIKPSILCYFSAFNSIPDA